MKRGLRFFIVFLLSFLLVSCDAIRSQVPVEKTIGLVDRGLESVEENRERTLPREERSDLAEEDIKEKSDFVEDKTIEDETVEDETLEDGIGNEEDDLPEDGVYASKDDVARYLFLYGHLPSNFITKKEAEKLGWKGGSLEPFAPGMCIGGSRFGNYEGLLPEKKGRVYTECDIDTLGAKQRGAKRIVFSNDGLIYYTEDHYKTFELLYGEKE